MISENGEFYLREEFERIYNIKTNFVQYRGIIHAIRAYARSHNIIRFSSKLKLPFIPVNIHLFIKSKQRGKDFYTVLNRNSDKPTSQAKWEIIYNVEQETWKVIYASPFHFHIGTKLQWFQTRINHRLLPTKKYLHNMKLVQSPNCNFCQEEETISHMLWECQESQSLIRQFIRWINNKNIDLTFTEELYIFNIGNTHSAADLQIFMIIKHYIYSAKRLNQPLSLIALQNKIKYFYLLQQHTATKNNCLDKFENEWCKYKALLQSIHWDQHIPLALIFKTHICINTIETLMLPSCEMVVYFSVFHICFFFFSYLLVNVLLWSPFWLSTNLFILNMFYRNAIFQYP